MCSNQGEGDLERIRVRISELIHPWGFLTLEARKREGIDLVLFCLLVASDRIVTRLARCYVGLDTLAPSVLSCVLIRLYGPELTLHTCADDGRLNDTVSRVDVFLSESWSTGIATGFVLKGQGYNPQQHATCCL